MIIRFFALEDTEQLERDIMEGDTLVKIADIGEGEYNPYDFSSSYYLDPITSSAYGVV